MKVFIGTHENCGLLDKLAYCFRTTGHEVTTFIKERDNFFPSARYDYDYYTTRANMRYRFKGLPILRSIEYRIKDGQLRGQMKRDFLSELENHDLFVYAWDTVLPNMSELSLVKAKGKKIVFIFFGSEVRDRSAFQQEYPEVNLSWDKDLEYQSFNTKLEFIRNAELYADAIFSVPDQSGLMIRPYYQIFHPYPIDNIPYEICRREVPRLVHAPSKRNVKGTSVIVSAIRRLESEGASFDFALIENKPNKEVLKELRVADIAIDQVFLHGPGVFTVEAMACGCAVASHIHHDTEVAYPAPICNIDESTVYDQLKYLIMNKDYRERLAIESRKFVERYNAPAAVVDKIINAASGTINPDYSPKFFADGFQCPQGESVSPENKRLTQQVINRHFDASEGASIRVKLAQKQLC